MPEPVARALALAVLLGGGCRLVGGGDAGVGEHASAGNPAGREPLSVLLWRACRPPAPGLSLGREAELDQERAEALGLLAGEPRLGRELRAILEDEQAPDELWGSAARAAAELERYELSPLLASYLTGGSSPARVLAARDALHGLYGRWFRGQEELAPYLEAVTPGEGTRLLLETSECEEARSRERLLAELAHAPSGAASWLGDPDPLVRAGAARVLGQVFLRPSEDAGATLAVLLAHLEREQDPRAFHEALLAALQPLEQAECGVPDLERLRASLAEIARAPADPRTSSVSAAIARIAWRKEGPVDSAHVLSGVECLGEILSGLHEADRRRGASDPDPMVATFAALRALCDQAGAGGFSTELRGTRARASVFAILQDPGQDVSARATAASSLGLLALPADWPVLASVLDDRSAAPAVKHALLGSLRSILPGFEPGDAGADELLRAVADLSGTEASDLRRRALALCADPRLEPLVRRLDPSFLVSRMEAEENLELASEILGLLARFGRGEMLGPLLSIQRFDQLAADPARLEELAATLGTLSAGSSRATMAAALRLSTVRSSATGLSCLRHALALASRLTDGEALELYPEEHRAIAEWAWRICRAGVPPRDAVSDGLALERRLLDVHLPRGEKAPPAGRDEGSFGPFERAHLKALLLADLALAGLGRSSRQEVEGAFEFAHELAPDPERNLVLRDRARFRAAADECVKALADYRRLLEACAGAADGGESLLGIPDLRSAIELLERVGGEGDRTSAAEACDLYLRLVARRSWRAEPAAVRMQDLRELVRTALAARDPGRLGRIEADLADLPLTQRELEGEANLPTLWYGLIREPAWFQELLDLRAQVRIGLRELQAQG